MEVTETGTAASSESTAPTSSAVESSSSSSSSVSPATGSSDSPAIVPAAAPTGEQPPAFQPNWKVKVMDKEHEIPEFLRGGVSTPEHEKQLKEMYEKALGLDEVKGSRERVRGEYQQFKQQVEPVMKTVQDASKFYQGAVQALEQGNAKGFTFKAEEAFKALGISDKVLQQYVYQKLAMEDLPADQKADYNRQRELELQYAQMQQQMHEQQNYFQQIQVQTRTQELQSATSKPEVASIVQSFDQRNGPGSFHQEVIQRGQLYWQTQQVDVPAEQLVQEIINKYGLSAQSAAAPEPQQQGNSQQAPVIPIIKGSSGSPAARSFKTAEDLIAYRKEKYGY